MTARQFIAFGLAAATIAVTVSLGNWQLRRAEEKLALQSKWDVAEQAGPVAVTGTDLAEVAAKLPLHVAVRGRFLYEHEVWLDNRQMDGRAGFMLVAPLRLADGAVVLVNRGFAPRDPLDRARLPEVARPAGEVTVAGLAVAQPARVLQLGENAPGDGRRPAVWQNFDFDAFERVSGLSVPRWVVQQTNAAGEEGLLRDWPRFSAGVDRHRGYALQWYSLAVLAATLTLVFGVRAWRQRHVSPSPSHD